MSSFDEMITPYRWLFIAMAVVPLLTTLYYAYRWHRVWVVCLLFLWGSLYPAGWLIRVFHLGSPLVRGYLTDVGFVAFFAAFGIAMYSLHPPPVWVSAARSYTLIGFLAAMGNEMIQMYLLGPAAAKKGLTIPLRGDPVDVVIFVVTALSVTALVNLLDRIVQLACPPSPVQKPEVPARLVQRRRKRKKRKKNRRSI